MKHTPGPAVAIWGWPLLAVGAPALVLFLGLLGGTFVLPAASWREGVLWGVFPVFGLGALLAFARIRSPELALTLALAVFVSTAVLAQYFFYEDARHAVAVAARSLADDDRPAAEIYDAWQREVLDEPDAGGWWDGLRAQAAAGISNRERLGPRRTGARYGDVDRRGWLVWGNWLVQHLMLAAGSLLALGFVPGIRHAPEQTQASQAIEDTDVAARDDDVTESATATPHPAPTEADEAGERALAEALLAQVQAEQAERRRAASMRRPSLPLATIRGHLPDLSDAGVELVREHLLLAWALDPQRAERPTLDQARHDALLAARLAWIGAPTAPLHPLPTDAVLLGARALLDAGIAEDLYESVRGARAAAGALAIRIGWMPLRQEFDLTGIDFPRVDADPRFDALLRREVHFDEDREYWPRLADPAGAEIPEGAYPAILAQLSIERDERTYDGFPLLRPSQLVGRLGPALRFARLTALERAADWFPHYAPEQRQALLAGLNAWPEPLALAVAEGALRSGWLRAIARVPKTQGWTDLLARHHPSPFGDLASEAPWFLGHLRRGDLPSGD